jgi:hypothetical protein
MEYSKDENKKENENEIDEQNKININYTSDENNNNNNEESNVENNYNFLKDDKILGRFSLQEKLYIINKLNVIVYNKIKQELMIELKRKRLENKILLIKSRIKTNLILHKKLQSLVQQKMIRDFNFKKKLKDFRKKLMDEKIESLKYKNIVCIMKAYGIYREDKTYR